jgi:signal transduction histidine kinase
MRSIYTKIVVWCSATLFFSALAAFFLSATVSKHLGNHDIPGPGFSQFLEAQAISVYKAEGPAGLAKFYDNAKQLAGISCVLSDSHGMDLASGRPGITPESGLGSYESVTPDGQFRFMAGRPGPRPPIGGLAMNFLFTLLLICGLCWLLASNIATPLRVMAATVERFGRGELSQRLQVRRKDEIGDLSRSFNEMAERIETLLKAEKRLLQDISHELRSPLARLGFAAQLMRTAKDREAAYERLNREIERLTELVTALVEVNRLEGDPNAGKREAVHLRGLLEELVEACRLETEPRGCRIQVEAAGSPIVLGDRELLRRAIENILRNTIRYAPELTTVEINLGQQGRQVTLTIRDFGPGVPDWGLARLFDPFFRVDESRDCATDGIGLGLSIADKVVRWHQGALRAANASPGLMVSMVLPRSS